MDTDMSQGHILGLDNIMALYSSTGHQVCMALEAA